MGVLLNDGCVSLLGMQGRTVIHKGALPGESGGAPLHLRTSANSATAIISHGKFLWEGNMAFLLRQRRCRKRNSVLDVLQIGSDNGESLYQVKWNDVPVAELHMMIKGWTALVELRLISTAEFIDSVFVSVRGPDWVRAAHTRVASMLNRHFPARAVRWSTWGSVRHD